MSNVPALSGKALIAALERVGFQVIRVKGSHHFLKHADGRTTVVPVHSGETLGPGILASILRNVQMSRKDLQNLL